MNTLILTYHFADNYGAVLQALALQRYLNKMGVDTEILDYRPIQYGIGDYTFWIRHGSFLTKLKDFIYGNIKALLTIKRKKNFRLFVKKYLNCTKEIYQNITDLIKSAPYADIYITGSDQVWNDEILGQCDEGYLLSFVKNSSLKVSYAASIGKDVISKEYAQKLKVYLKSFDFISVRETAAKKELQNVGLNNTIQVIDPVFLLDSKEYEEFLVKPAIEDYVFIYCFGYNEQCYNLAKLIAKKNNLKTISINGWTNKFHTDYFINTASPSEFLGYLKNAKYVVTNSFHGTAFSIIFEKEFYSIAPISRVSRIEELLKAADITDRLIYDNIKIEGNEVIDYQLVKKNLSENITLSKKYLKNVIDTANRKKMCDV